MFPRIRFARDTHSWSSIVHVSIFNFCLWNTILIPISSFCNNWMETVKYMAPWKLAWMLHELFMCHTDWKSDGIDDWWREGTRIEDGNGEDNWIMRRWYKYIVWLVKIKTAMNEKRWTQIGYQSKEKEKEWSKDDRTNRGDRSDCKGGWMSRKIEERESLRWEVTYKRTKNLVIEGEVGGRMNTCEVEREREVRVWKEGFKHMDDQESSVSILSKSYPEQKISLNLALYSKFFKFSQWFALDNGSNLIATNLTPFYMVLNLMRTWIWSLVDL